MKRIALFVLCIIASCAFGYAQNHWTSNKPGSDAYNLLGYIVIDDEEVFSESLEIGSFNSALDDLCVGADWAPFEYDGHMLTFVTFYGTVGDVVTFKLYDHDLEKELELNCEVSATLTTNGGCIGCEFTDYFEFRFTTPAPQPTTYELPITGYEAENPVDWYFISSPVGDVATGDVQGLTTGTFDLYSFDQNGDAEGKEWINMHDGGTLAAGQGYLYANSANTTLIFSGEAYTGMGTFPLEYSTTNPDETMHGWNLVGNPFAQPASVGDRAFYVMNDAGSEIIVGSGNVPAMNGIFVKATAENQSVTFTPNGTNTGSKLALNLVRNDRSASLVDRAVVRFDQGGTLPKFMLDPTNTRVYIPQDGEDYAVATCGDDNVMPVSFKAKENGSYTLKVSIDNVEMGYLHLIDNKTGNDIDLLATPSYSFEANSHDYAERFSLVYATTDGLNESFAFFNGSNWIIENGGKALLQVVDVTGRVLRSEQISGNAEIDLGNVAGVYVLRLINGDNVRVQKVIVK